MSTLTSVTIQEQLLKKALSSKPSQQKSIVLVLPSSYLIEI
jgi:hypothetical protein